MLAGLDSSSRVIIIVDSIDVVFVARKGRRGKGGEKRAGVIGALLDVVFDVAEPLGSWPGIKLI